MSLQGIIRDWPDSEAQFFSKGRMYGIDFPGAQNLFESSLRGTIYISHINAEVT